MFLVAIAVVIGGLWIGSESYSSEGEGCGFLLIVVGIILGVCVLFGAFHTPTPEEAKQAKIAAQQKAVADKKEADALAAKNAIDDRLTQGEVILVNTAPDGTKLWMAKDKLGNVVYFSNSGTTKDGKPVPATTNKPGSAPAPVPTAVPSSAVEPARTGRPL